MQLLEDAAGSGVEVRAESLSYPRLPARPPACSFPFQDIPALLLSPHHASALQSLSSTEEDPSVVSDFADLARAREGDRALQGEGMGGWVVPQ